MHFDRDVLILYYYSVMQSYGNSLGGDVVSDSFKKTLRDEENVLDQID